MKKENLGQQGIYIINLLERTNNNRSSPTLFCKIMENFRLFLQGFWGMWEILFAK
ncbi:hypothetical protein [Brevibacillus sp. SAFN-007a]|uniref:hypothetical protein n=1 Tax=Brevibacillus sp. SAFN-007a TaxID=3436862 RepID=UPI003F80109D